MPRGPRCLFIMGNFIVILFSLSTILAFPKSLIDVVILCFYFAPRNLAFPFSHRKEASTTKVHMEFSSFSSQFWLSKKFKNLCGTKRRKKKKS